MKSRVLNHLKVRLNGWLTLRTLLWVLAALGLGTLALLLLDAGLNLSDEARAGLLWCCGAVIFLLLGSLVLLQYRLTAIRVAQFFEHTHPGLGTRLTNAVQLARRSPESPVEEYFRLETVELGEQAARGVRTWPVARKPVYVAGAATAIALAGWCLVAFLSREMLDSVLPRYLDPHGDHPPYSQLKIKVGPTNAMVLYGGQLEVRATTSGRPADKLWLVAKAGTNITRALMFLAPDKSFFQTLVNLQQAAEFYVTDGWARSYRASVGIRYTPQITLVEVTTEFPAYTRKPTRTEKLQADPVALPLDTRVSFRLVSNRPLTSGLLSLTPVLGGRPVDVLLKTADQPSAVTGSFKLTEAVAFTLSVRDVDGLDCAQPARGRFNIRPDERPRLHVLEPGRNAVATPTISIPVRIQAEDDYGVERVLWLRGHNRSIERPFTMKLTMRTGPQLVEAAGSFDLSKLGVRPGDVIDYYFEAADNYPQGPNVTLSRLYKLEIISKEQYEQILKMAAARKALFEPYFKLDAWLRRMAERARNLENKAETGKPDSEIDKEAGELAEQMEKYEGELGKVMESAMLFDIEQAFRENLVKQHNRIGSARKNLKNQLSRGKPTSRELSDLAKELSELSQDEERDVREPAQQIAAVAHVLARADDFVRLGQQQAAIAQLLRRFADKGQSLTRAEQMEVRELAYQQQRVQEGLHRILTSLPELVAKVPDDPQFDALRNDVKNFIEAVNEAKIEQDQEGAVKALNEPDTMTGFALANAAAEKMDKLIGKCNGMPQQGQQCLTRFRPSLSKLGNTMQQILAAMSGNNSGPGDNGRDGYSLFNDDAALYGPNMELAGKQGGGRDEDASGSGEGKRFSSVSGDNREFGGPKPPPQGRVRLQPDANFPLRYRDLVGEYFRAIAEAGAEEGGKK